MILGTLNYYEINSSRWKTILKSPSNQFCLCFQCFVSTLHVQWWRPRLFSVFCFYLTCAVVTTTTVFSVLFLPYMCSGDDCDCFQCFVSTLHVQWCWPRLFSVFCFYFKCAVGTTMTVFSVLFLPYMCSGDDCDCFQCFVSTLYVQWWQPRLFSA